MSRIIATGAYLPERVITNTELIQSNQLDSSTEWIEQRTGIKQRHFAEEHETVASIATEAAENLLSKLEDNVRQEIKLIIVATMSQREYTPSTANRVQLLLECEQAVSFDINAACSGFIYALDVAEKMSRTFTSGYTLVIGAEKMSQILDLSDRGTAILFGDGAGAILIENDGEGLVGYDSQLHSQGDKELSIEVKANDKDQIFMSMKGRDVFNFVQRTVLPSIEEFMNQHDSLDFLISHQANYRFIKMMSKKFKMDLSNIPSNIHQVGNTSAGSIPILLNQLVENNQIKLNGSQSIIMTGFGAGLTWGEIFINI
ncbi:beta-ketoacyl-ACP synthase 3 [Aerococcaceae bacterium WGS1372]